MEQKNEKDNLNKKEVREELRGGHNSRGRGRSEAEKRESYARYRENKKKVIELEARNKEYLILWPASDVDTNEKNKFYNMGGNSAIIYVHEIAPRIGRKNATLRHDLDLGTEKFHSGFCSIANLELLQNKLKMIGIKRVKVKAMPELVFFKLNRSYEHDEIKMMLREEQKRLDELNSLLYSKVLFPEIHRLMLDLIKLVPSKVKNMPDKVYRGMFGDRAVEAVLKLNEIYTQMAHGDMEELVAGKEMLITLDVLAVRISALNESQQWEVSSLIRIAEKICMLRQLITGKIINKNRRIDSNHEINK